MASMQHCFFSPRKAVVADLFPEDSPSHKLQAIIFGTPLDRRPYKTHSRYNFSVQWYTIEFVSNHSSADEPLSMPSIQVFVQQIIAVP